MPGLSFDSDAHCYGFNGMEKDDELPSQLLTTFFLARIYGSRIGDFLSLAPRMA